MEMKLGGFLINNADNMPADEFDELFEKYAEYVLDKARKKSSSSDEETNLNKENGRMSRDCGEER